MIPRTQLCQRDRLWTPPPPLPRSSTLTLLVMHKVRASSKTKPACCDSYQIHHQLRCPCWELVPVLGLEQALVLVFAGVTYHSGAHTVSRAHT